MRKILLTLFSLLIFFFSQLNFTALAEINFNHLTNIQLQQISEIQSSLHTINDLQLTIPWSKKEYEERADVVEL